MSMNIACGDRDTISLQCSRTTNSMVALNCNSERNILQTNTAFLNTELNRNAGNSLKPRKLLDKQNINV